MSKDEIYQLPDGPADLCFDKSEFVQDFFSADKFLQNHRMKANLEQLRDDLGIYLKVLRSAMIELINRDYADFVNLSANLIGLDKAINNIQSPLGQLKEEILQVRSSLNDAISEGSELMERQRKIRAKKRSVQCLIETRKLLPKLSALLQLSEEECSPEVINRIVCLYGKLKYCFSKCENHVTYEHKQLSGKIYTNLMSKLDKIFLGCVSSQDIKGTECCLRNYVTLSEREHAELLLRKQVIGQSLHDVISEYALQNNPSGLKAVYTQILAFIVTRMKYLLVITASSERTVTGFEFLVNSFWPEVEERLELHASSIFAPGNPEIFYKNFCDTMDFLKEIENFCSCESEVKRFHKHPQYVAFLQRWNLPIYFQIRFQEIAGAFETVLSTVSLQDMLLKESEFNLKATSSAWDSILRCWSDGVFLQKLTRRFWKLSLQIPARYCVWIEEALAKKWPSSSSGVGGTSAVNSSVFWDHLRFCILLYIDTSHFATKLVTVFFPISSSKFPNYSEQMVKKIEESLDVSVQQLKTQLTLIRKNILELVCSECMLPLKQVSDIPRLFRRTNREVPTKPCSYISSCLSTPLSFHRTFSSTVDGELLKEWLTMIFSNITEQFYMSVDDVLTSVQKTEESLRRLKKIRDKSVPSANATEAKGIGDDDKIREQLLLDVYSFCEGVESVGVKRDDVTQLKELICLVESARSKIDAQKI